jgi:penicillin amidase
LQGQVEVFRDRWGVPHIYARSAPDLFFAQGYVHAQDRLWQMDLQRRAGSGRLSELLGEMTLEMDRFFRVVGLGRAAEAEFEAMDDEMRAVLQAYAAGINAHVEDRQGRAGVEYSLLRCQPEPWRAVDTLYLAKLLSWTLGCNWSTELIRARMAAKLGAVLAADLEPPYPAHSPGFVGGEGLAPDAASPPSGWGSEAQREAMQLIEDLFRPGKPASLAEAPPGMTPAAGGSNQWVVAGSRSATGQPLLANDTHLQLSMPAGWYEMHLVGAGYNVSGVSFPGAPGVIIGHNDHCAWGLTTAFQDAQDLYVEKLNPEDPHRYEYQGEWQQAAVVREEIQVKGWEQPVVEEVVITRHGPIISAVVGEEVPLALCWVALEPSNLLGSVLSYNRARSWREFRQALGKWSAPAHNFVYADVEGNIGYVQAGWMPVRDQGFGQAPVPGWTGEYEWQGYLSLDDLPQAFNPEDGWLATANHWVATPDYPHYIGGDVENPCRARRVVDLVTSKPVLDADDFARFQRDTFSLPAESFVQHLRKLEPQNEVEDRALSFLREWDACLDVDSVAASIYQVSRIRALHVVFDGHLGELADDYIGLDTITPVGTTSPFYGRSIERLLEVLDGKEDDFWLSNPVGGPVRDPQLLLRQALGEALELLEAELGPDMDRWTWGRLNRVHFAHPVGSVKPLNLVFNRGPYPTAGDQDTLLRSAGAPKFPLNPVAVGDAVRFIADVSDWEQCRIVIPGGQSGHVASRHYADLIPLWREGRFQPMPFGRDQVERQAVVRLVLLPEEDGDKRTTL